MVADNVWCCMFHIQYSDASSHFLVVVEDFMDAYRAMRTSIGLQESDEVSSSTF